MAWIPRVKQTWTDGAGGGTPVSAARMNDLETGVFDAHFPPAARVYHNANQSTTSGADFVLAFNSERFDTASNTADTQHDNSSNNSRLTCRYAGVYQISGTIAFAANGAGSRYAKIRLNGSTEIARELRTAASSDTHTINISVLQQLSVNDYVELLALQSSGGPLNVLAAASYSPEFMFVRVA